MLQSKIGNDLNHNESHSFPYKLLHKGLKTYVELENNGKLYTQWLEVSDLDKDHIIGEWVGLTEIDILLKDRNVYLSAIEIQ